MSSMTDEESQAARNSIFAIIEAWNAIGLSNEKAIQFCIEINAFYSRASSDQHIKEDNMTADEKRIALEFLADEHFNLLPGRFIDDCGSHDTNYLYKGLILYRCELFAQFIRLINPPHPSLNFECLISEEDFFLLHFLSTNDPI